MDIRSDQITQKAQIKLCDKAAACDLANDYTLPDYLPEIRRVLGVNASVIETSKYVSGSRAEFCGSVDYRLLYVASDGGLYSAPLSSEYTLSLPLEIASNVDLSDGVVLICEPSAESISTRVSAPRRVSIKCKVTAAIRAYGMAITSELISGEYDEASTEKLICECKTERVIAAISNATELSTEIAIDSDQTRIIDAGAKLVIFDVSHYESLAEVRGEAVIEMLICNDTPDAEPRLIVQKLPYEDRIELDELCGDSECTARGRITDLNVSVNENAILCSLSADTEIIAHTETTHGYVKDLYSTTNHTDCAYKSYTLPTHVGRIFSNFTQSERIELDAGALAIGAKAISCNCFASVDSCSFEDGKAVISGQCRYSVVAKKDGEYFCFDRNVPFKYRAVSTEPHFSYSASVFPISCTASIDNSVLSLDAELSISAELSGKTEITALSEVRFGEAMPKKNNDIIICYPSALDTLWSVSKRYAVPVLKLEGISSPEEKLEKVKYLTVNF